MATNKLSPRHSTLLAAVLLAVPLLTGCGGDSADEKTVSGLSTEEKKTLCDDLAKLWGGYGKTKDCGDGATVSNDKDQDTCVKGHTKCTATVAAVKACGAEFVKDACSEKLPAACANIPESCIE